MWIKSFQLIKDRSRILICVWWYNIGFQHTVKSSLSPLTVIRSFWFLTSTSNCQMGCIRVCLLPLSVCKYFHRMSALWLRLNERNNTIRVSVGVKGFAYCPSVISARYTDQPILVHLPYPSLRLCGFQIMKKSIGNEDIVILFYILTHTTMSRWRRNEIVQCVATAWMGELHNFSPLVFK